MTEIEKTIIKSNLRTLIELSYDNVKRLHRLEGSSQEDIDLAEGTKLSIIEAIDKYLFA